MSNEVMIYSVPDLKEMGRVMAATGMFGFKKPDEAFALMLIAQAEGKHPATIAQDYDVIQGRPALKLVGGREGLKVWVRRRRRDGRSRGYALLLRSP